MNSRLVFIYGMSFFSILGLAFACIYAGFFNALISLLMLGLSIILLILV